MIIRGGHCLARAIVEHRKAIALGWLAAALAVLPSAAGLEEKLEVSAARSDPGEAVQVEELLETRFAAPFASFALLVAEGVPPPDTPAGRSVLRRIAGTVEGLPRVTRTLSYEDVRDPAFVGRDGTFLVVSLATRERSAGHPMERLREATARLEAELRAQHPQARLAWTGAASFDYDVRAASAADARRAEWRVLPLTLALLVVVFGSVAAAVLPVVLAALAIGLAFGVAAWLAAWWPQTILLQNIVTMIGLGIGIDYALLLVARFREALPAGAREAAVEAAREAGGTVLLSGAGVAIGFAALLAVPANELRSIAVGGCLVVALSVLLATTLLPGLLAALGTRVKPGRAGGRVWRRWGELVVAHPVAVLVLALLPLVALSLPLRHLSTDIPSGIWLPAHTESARGAAALERLGQAGMAQTLRVVVEMPAGTRVSDERGWREALRVSRAIEADARAARVRSLPLLLKQGERVPRFDIVPPDLLGSYVSRDERLALVDVVPREGLTTRELMRFAHDLRAIGGVKVGGLPAFNADYQHAVGSSVGRVVALIVGGTFVALLIGFRAPLVALKAVALNLVSVAAAMGAAVLVFQDGYGARLFGLAAPLDGLFPAVPIIAFCVVFGLSIDYEVFLVARVHEALRAGAGADEALVDALARTGGVITSAALVMILVFAGFAAGELVIIQILGFTLAAAVLIDATLVRLALGPALLKLGGRWNWWPSLRRPRSRRP